MSAKKQAEKRYTRKVKRVTTVMSQGSLTATPKSKISRTKTTIEQEATTINNNATTTPTIAESLLQFDCCCVCFLFDFYFKLMFCLCLVRFLNVVAELMIQSKGLLSDTPWARPGEFFCCPWAQFVSTFSRT